MIQPLSEDMVAFLEGIIHQETFEKNGFRYDMKTFTSHDRADAYITKNEGFSVMHESNGYIYVGTKVLIEEPGYMSEQFSGRDIYESAIKSGLTEEQAHAILSSIGG